MNLGIFLFLIPLRPTSEVKRYSVTLSLHSSTTSGKQGVILTELLLLFHHLWRSLHSTVFLKPVAKTLYTWTLQLPKMSQFVGTPVSPSAHQHYFRDKQAFHAAPTLKSTQNK